MTTKPRREYIVNNREIVVYEYTSIEYIIVDGEVSARNDHTNKNKSKNQIYYFGLGEDKIDLIPHRKKYGQMEVQEYINEGKEKLMKKYIDHIYDKLYINPMNNKINYDIIREVSKYIEENDKIIVAYKYKYEEIKKLITIIGKYVKIEEINEINVERPITLKDLNNYINWFQLSNFKKIYEEGTKDMIITMWDNARAYDELQMNLLLLKNSLDNLMDIVSYLFLKQNQL